MQEITSILEYLCVNFAHFEINEENLMYMWVGNVSCHSSKQRMFESLPGGPVVKTPPSRFRGPGFIPGQGTRSHMLQLRAHMPQLKIPHAATEILHAAMTKGRCRQINK